MSGPRQMYQPNWDLVEAAFAEMQVAQYRYERAFQMARFIEAGGCEFEIPPLEGQGVAPSEGEIAGTCIGYLSITTPLQEAYKALDEADTEIMRWEKAVRVSRRRACAAFRRSDSARIDAEFAAKKAGA